MKNSDDNRRQNHSGGPDRGPGWRTYPNTGGNAPRVGRIAQNVPKARQVTADVESDAGEREIYRGNKAHRRETVSNTSFHRGTAYRAPTGPRPPCRDDAGEVVAPSDDERILAGRNPIREALRAGRPVEKLLVAAGELSGAAQEIVRMARDAGAWVTLLYGFPSASVPMRWTLASL